jgi:hypothetical protein
MSEIVKSKVQTLKAEMLTMPQYQPETTHHFHAGMYCRAVWREAGVVIVGRVHKKEHFYMVASGTVTITSDDGVMTVTGPHLFSSKPGTQRAVYAVTDALCMTFHVTESVTPEDAEKELVVEEEHPMFDAHNHIKQTQIEVTL